jgi:tRNA 2-thiocytidine biosynthesis protein TtcA
MFGFVDLKTDGIANPNGDIAFDEELSSTPSTLPGTIPLQPL